MRVLGFIVACLLSLNVFGQGLKLDKIYFNVSAVTTSATLAEVTAPNVHVGELVRIAIELDSTKLNDFDIRLYADSVYTGERFTLFSADNVVTNANFMPLYAASGYTGSVTNELLPYTFFEDSVVLSTGAATITNSSAKVTLIYERRR